MTDVFGQPTVCIIMVYGGMLLGVLYTFFRLLRAAWPSKWCTVACDLLFLLCAAAVSAYCMLITTDGVLRAYAVAALGASLVLTRYAFSVVFTPTTKKRHKN